MATRGRLIQRWQLAIRSSRHGPATGRANRSQDGNHHQFLMYKISNVISAEKAESSERNAVNKSPALTMNLSSEIRAIWHRCAWHGPTKLLSNYTRGKRRRLKVKSSIVLLSANFPLREKIPKLHGFSPIQTWLTFTRTFPAHMRARNAR